MENFENGTKYKVVKDQYYVVEDNGLEGEFVTMEEIMNQVSHVCCKDDEYVITGIEYGEVIAECVSGKWEGQSNDGWFCFQDMVNKGVLVEVK